jgi:MFS transporter, DHA1 family, tetracycline resistance protein
MLLIASSGIAIGNSLVTPTLNSLASKSIAPAFQGRILGAMASVASLARIIGPMLGGFLLGRDHEQDVYYGKTVYWASGTVMLIALALAVSLHARSAEAGNPTVAIEE